MEPSLSFRLIAVKDYGSMPWKNGLGVTSQIDINPPFASFPSDPFNWRLSSAAITGPNAFSLFPGCDRILAVWTGPGLELNRNHSLLPLVPYTFRGEEPIDCQLIEPSSQVVDFGIIFNRDNVKASMAVGSGDVVLLGHGTHYFTCVSGGFSTTGHAVNAGDTLVCNNNSKSDITIQLEMSTDEDTKYFHTHVRMINL